MKIFPSQKKKSIQRSSTAHIMKTEGKRNRKGEIFKVLDMIIKLVYMHIISSIICQLSLWKNLQLYFPILSSLQTPLCLFLSIYLSYFIIFSLDWDVMTLFKIKLFNHATQFSSKYQHIPTTKKQYIQWKNIEKRKSKVKNDVNHSK